MSTATFTSKRLPYNITTVNFITAVVMVVFHIGAIAAFFALSNRMANMIAMRPNDEFFTMGRAAKQ